jgi:hypothetical protein
MISPDPVGEASGIPAAFYFLLGDTREKFPMMANTIHMKAPFNRMLLRHNLWKKNYPDSLEVHGVPWQALANASQKIKDLASYLSIRLSILSIWTNSHSTVL